MKKEKVIEFCKRNYIFFICGIHLLLSWIASYNFFYPLREHTGIENVAYKFFNTGKVLEDDTISRVLCYVYAHILSFLIILVFWNRIFFLVNSWMKYTEERTYIKIYLLFVVIGILMILTLYPITVTIPSDTTYNYVYAREWLPMYWHGFLTNVIHCACLLIFPHPVSMSVIPYLFGISVIFYFSYHIVIKYSMKYKIAKVLIWFAILLIIPETIQLLTYAGRNYMYAILSVSVLGIFLKDYLEQQPLKSRKFLLLSFLVVCLATWRSEGILYLFFYPFLIYFTYFYKKKTVKKKEMIKGFGYICVLYLIMALPGKYGNEKYQGYDYFIINTPGPLSAVFINEEANFDYNRANEDLSQITDVVPLEYIYKYGKLATAYYNAENGRLSRQCNVGEAGKDYVIASYRMLFHNWKIYLKYQMNLFFRSIGLSLAFDLPTVNEEEWTLSGEFCKRWDWVIEYYTIGENDMSNNHDIVLLNNKVDSVLNEYVLLAVSKVHGFGWKYLGFVKVAVTCLVAVTGIYFLKKKEWIYVLWAVIILALLSAIILTAPAMRDNYYYSVYFNQYWFLLFSGFQIKKSRNVCGRQSKEN